ncbi:MAG TPA: helix-turn-helix domain-containing protein [Gemmatimonadaceae bacterium]|nr:helix-turn-helix domain-containing protein [Gemmatimonadaceae bacterium]
MRPTGPTEIRCLRLRMQLSQPQFAARLGVSAETYRAWDSGRRVVPDGWLEKARTLAVVEAPDRQWSLPHLATQLGVHVRTLRQAARNGRLAVTYGNRVVFRNPVPTATLASGRAFIERYYRRSYSRFAPKPITPVPVCVPPDCAQRLRAMRLELGFTQAALAQRLGAAGKAVVYQWESGKRRPSSVLWRKIEELHAHADLQANTPGRS